MSISLERNSEMDFQMLNREEWYFSEALDTGPHLTDSAEYDIDGLTVAAKYFGALERVYFIVSSADDRNAPGNFPRSYGLFSFSIWTKVQSQPIDSTICTNVFDEISSQDLCWLGR